MRALFCREKLLSTEGEGSLSQRYCFHCSSWLPKNVEHSSCAAKGTSQVVGVCVVLVHQRKCRSRPSESKLAEGGSSAVAVSLVLEYWAERI